MQKGLVLFFGFRSTIYFVLNTHRHLGGEMKVNLNERLGILLQQKEKPPASGGLEPTTFELEVQHTSSFRHGGIMSPEKGNFCVHFFTSKQHFRFPSITNF